MIDLKEFLFRFMAAVAFGLLVFTIYALIDRFLAW